MAFVAARLGEQPVAIVGFTKHRFQATGKRALTRKPPPAAKTVQKHIYFTKSLAGGMRRLCLPVRFSRFPPEHQCSPKWAFGCLTDCGQFAGPQSGERGMEHGQ